MGRTANGTANGNARTVTMRSGDTLTVTLEGRPLLLAAKDRDFVDRLLAFIETYEQERDADASAPIGSVKAAL